MLIPLGEALLPPETAPYTALRSENNVDPRATQRVCTVCAMELEGMQDVLR